MRIEKITISAVVHSTEDQRKVREAIAILSPFELKIEVTNITGHYGNPMSYLKAEILKKSEIKELWNYLMGLLGEQKEILMNTLEERTDEQNVLHIRIDKQKAYLGKIKLADRGDALILRAKIVTYPSKRKNVLEAVKGLIEHGC
jgi:hypothetical protein